MSSHRKHYRNKLFGLRVSVDINNDKNNKKLSKEDRETIKKHKTFLKLYDTTKIKDKKMRSEAVEYANKHLDSNKCKKPGSEWKAKPNYKNALKFLKEKFKLEWNSVQNGDDALCNKLPHFSR